MDVPSPAGGTVRRSASLGDKVSEGRLSWCWILRLQRHRSPLTPAGRERQRPHLDIARPSALAGNAPFLGTAPPPGADPRRRTCTGKADVECEMLCCRDPVAAPRSALPISA
jgi:hypothetical protein